MKKFISLIICLAFLLSCSPVLAQTSTGTVSGKIYDASGAVLANVTVVLENPLTGFSAQDISDATGAYQFTSVPAGDIYGLKLVRNGYTIGSKVVKVRVDQGKETKLQNWMQQTMIYGLVTDDNGGAVGGATINLQGNGINEMTVTSADGYFEFVGKDKGPGRYALNGTRSGVSIATVDVDLPAKAFRVEQGLPAVRTKLTVTVPDAPAGTPVFVLLPGTTTIVGKTVLPVSKQASIAGYFSGNYQVRVVPLATDYGVKVVDISLSSGEQRTLTIALTAATQNTYTAGSMAELTTAINSANTDGTPSLVNITGDFTVTGSSDITDPRTVIDLNGHTLTYTSVGVPCFLIKNGAANCAVTNGTFDGNSATRRMLFVEANADNAVIDKITISNAVGGAEQMIEANGPGATLSALQLNATGSLRIAGNGSQLQNSVIRGDSGRTQVTLTGNNCWINNDTIIDVSGSTTTNFGIDANATGTVIENNTIGVKGVAVRVRNEAWLIGNTINGGVNGLVAIGTSGTDAFRLYDNIIRGTTNRGLVLDTADIVVLNNNTIVNNGTEGVFVTNPVDNSDYFLNSNTLADNGADGVSADLNTRQNVSVRLNNNTVRNNDNGVRIIGGSANNATRVIRASNNLVVNNRQDGLSFKDARLNSFRNITRANLGNGRVTENLVAGSDDLNSTSADNSGQDTRGKNDQFSADMSRLGDAVFETTDPTLRNCAAPVLTAPTIALTGKPDLSENLYMFNIDTTRLTVKPPAANLETIFGLSDLAEGRGNDPVVGSVFIPGTDAVTLTYEPGESFASSVFCVAMTDNGKYYQGSETVPPLIVGTETKTQTGATRIFAQVGGKTAQRIITRNIGNYTGTFALKASASNPNDWVFTATDASGRDITADLFGSGFITASLRGQSAQAAGDESYITIAASPRLGAADSVVTLTVTSSQYQANIETLALEFNASGMSGSVGYGPVISGSTASFVFPGAIAAGLASISPGNSETVTLKVYNLAGKTVLNKEVSLSAGSNTVDADISGLGIGSYTYLIVNSKGKVTLSGKFAIVR